MKRYLTLITFIFWGQCIFSQEKSSSIHSKDESVQPINIEGRKIKKKKIEFKILDGCNEWYFNRDSTVSNKICGTCTISHQSNYGSYYQSNDTIYILENRFTKSGILPELSLKKISKRKKSETNNFEIELTGNGSENYVIRRIVWKKRPLYFNKTKNSYFSKETYDAFTNRAVYIKRISIYNKKFDKYYWVEIDQNLQPKKYSYTIELWDKKSIITENNLEMELKHWDYKKETYLTNDKVKFEQMN